MNYFQTVRITEARNDIGRRVRKVKNALSSTNMDRVTARNVCRDLIVTLTYRAAAKENIPVRCFR